MKHLHGGHHAANCARAEDAVHLTLTFEEIIIKDAEGNEYTDSWTL